jgi:conjugal transfer pilus assembly protein TraF
VNILTRLIMVSIVTGAIALPNLLWSNTPSSSYYDSSRHGWWWYEDPPKKSPKPKDARPHVTPRTLPSLKDYTIDEIYRMHPDDFQALLNDLLKKAVMMPDNPEAMEEYARMQDIARRRSEAYANAFAAVQRQHPEWDVLAAAPVNYPGRMARLGMDMDEITQTIREGRKDFGLVFFTKHDCPFCIEQGRILGHFLKKYHWDFKKVDISHDPTRASIFSVRMVPSLILVSRLTGNHLIVSSGVLSLEDIERSIHEGIRLLDGRTKPEELMRFDHQKGGPLDPYAPIREEKNKERQK